jgi:hypothetical protein
MPTRALCLNCAEAKADRGRSGTGRQCNCRSCGTSKRGYCAEPCTAPGPSPVSVSTSPRAMREGGRTLANVDHSALELKRKCEWR